MRVIHVCLGTPGRNAKGGGHIFHWQNIHALARLGHDVHLAIRDPDDAVDDDVRAVAASINYLTTVPPSPFSIDHLLGRVLRPETMLFRFPEWGGLRHQVRTLVDRLEPDFIWADSIWSIPLVPEGVPYVYGHLDFVHQLQAVRRAKFRKVLRRPDPFTMERLRARELEMARGASYVFSVSSSDVDVIAGAGAGGRVTYVPIVGQDIPRSPARVGDATRAILVGRQNTAMKVSRLELMEKIFPALGARVAEIEWHQVGEPPKNQSAAEAEWLQRHFTQHGYVRDLETVLRPGDLSLIPYPADTGFRAKFVTASGHGMVNFGYTKTFECASEYVPGENCLAAETPAQYADVLLRYAADRGMRQRLADASRATYEKHFTLDAQLPIYAAGIEVAMRRGTSADSAQEAWARR